MTRHVAHRSVEQLFDDRSLADDNPLRDVDRFFDQVRAEYGTLAPPPPRYDLARLFRDEPERPSNVVALPLARSVDPRRFGRFRALRPLVAAALIALTATIGLAAAQALPGPVQRAVSRIADNLGIDLPGTGDTDARHPADPSVPPSDSPGSAPAHATTETGAPAGGSDPASGTPPVATASPDLDEPVPTGTPTASLPPPPLPAAPPELPPLPQLPLLPPLPPLPSVPTTLPRLSNLP